MSVNSYKMEEITGSPNDGNDGDQSSLLGQAQADYLNSKSALGADPATIKKKSLNDIIKERVSEQLNQIMANGSWGQPECYDDEEEYDEYPSQVENDLLGLDNNAKGKNCGKNDDESCDELPIHDLLKTERNNYKGEDSPGPALKSKYLATLINDMLQNDLTENRLNAKTEKYSRPQNIEKLAVTRINKPLWRKLSSEAKQKDIKAQAFQKTMLKGLIPLFQLTDELLDKSNDDSMTQKALDSMGLLCQAHRDINAWRKTNIEQELAGSYRQLCTEDDVNEPLLFDNLQEKIKCIQETDKLTYKIRGSYNRRPMRGGRVSSYQANRRPYMQGRPSRRGFLYHGQGALNSHGQRGRGYYQSQSPHRGQKKK